jgi:hypothetical protein
MSKAFNNKNQIKEMYVDYLDKAYPTLSGGSRNPNRSPEITTPVFSKTVDELDGPFAKAVEACYA